MQHLTQLEIEQLHSGEPIARTARAHFDQCTLCRQRVADAGRMDAALMSLTRAEPAADLSARIIATLPSPARQANPAFSPWLGVATLLAALFGFALAFQAALTLRANGAFELVSYYTTQPEIVTTYPGEAWGALADSIPWMTVAIGMLTLAVAVILMYRWAARNPARVAG